MQRRNGDGQNRQNDARLRRQDKSREVRPIGLGRKYFGQPASPLPWSNWASASKP
jgi:hypothetical protein